MRRNIFDLSGKTILVTGANSGIGLAYATALAESGADLVIWGRRAERNEEVAERLARENGVTVFAQNVDVSREHEVKTAFAEAVTRVGEFHAVFANAGRLGPRAPVGEIPIDDYRAVVETNQFGTFFTAQEAGAHMMACVRAGSRPGSIVITGSSSMLWATWGNAAYAMTKGALDALTRAMAVDYGEYGIRVNSILPGMILSEIGHKGATNDWIKTYSAMRRPGAAEELGGIAVYLASDASSYHTGDSIVVDGGLSIRR